MADTTILPETETEGINQLIEDTIARIKSINDPKQGRHGTKRNMSEILGLIVIEYVVFGKFELEDIAAAINEALRGMCNRGTDIKGELAHVGKLVLERQQ
jgi:hypothetical protein